MGKKTGISIILIFVGLFVAYAQTETVNLGTQAYDALHVPHLENVKSGRPIIVAVVDDGFLLTHKSLKKFIYTSTKEIGGNTIDDDENGYADDVSGWDVSDRDNDVSVPAGKEEIYYHGTMVASIIAQELQLCFGDKASELVKIMPVKALADNASKTYIVDGYDGIAYAVAQNVDVICVAWSGGVFDNKYATIFDEANRKGITILCSAGNFFSERIEPPATLPTTYVVAAIDSTFKKIKSSNYGKKIDLVANGDKVKAGHPLKDIAYFNGEQTSAAVALIAGAATILKVMAPEARPSALMEALKNTARPLDSINSSISGKLGAGIPDISKAVEYLTGKNDKDFYFNSKQAEGTITISGGTKRENWEVAPSGSYKFTQFMLTSSRKNGANNILSFYTKDSLCYSGVVKDFPAFLNVPGGYTRITYQGKRGNSPVTLSYYSEPVDSTTFYCKDTQIPTAVSGIFTDGSGDNNYANRTTCKWQLTAPQGQRIRIEFEEFSTEAKIDIIMLFDGTETLQENQIAQFSGPSLPPIIISATNQVLVWFSTNDTVTDKGWKLKYTATDEPPGVFPPKQK